MRKYAFIFIGAFLAFSCLNTAQAEEKGFFGFSKKEDGKKAQTKPAQPSKAVVPSDETAPAAAKKAEPQGVTAEANLAAVQMRMANNKSLTDADKASLAAAALKHFPQGADVRSASFEQQMLRFEQIANDPNMTVDAKKSEITKGLGPAQETVVAAKPAPVSIEELKQQDVVKVEAVQEAAALPVVEEAPVTDLAVEPVEQKIVPAQEVKEAKAAVKEEVKAVKKTGSNFSKKKRDS